MGDTIGIIEARMSGGGLPGRCLAPLAHRPLLDQMHRRLCRSKVEDWWLVTSTDPSDDVVEAWGFELGLRVYRARGTDLLGAFGSAAVESRAERIVRVLADQPFVGAGLIDLLLDASDATEEAKRADFVEIRSSIESGQGAFACDTTASSGGLPAGFGVPLFRREGLERAQRALAGPNVAQPLPVAAWLHRHGDRFDVPIPADWPSRPQWRWVLDSYSDLAMARSAFRLFGSESQTIDYPAMVERLDAHPEITAMNVSPRPF